MDRVRRYSSSGWSDQKDTSALATFDASLKSCGTLHWGSSARSRDKAYSMLGTGSTIYHAGDAEGWTVPPAVAITLGNCFGYNDLRFSQVYRIL